jgi:hypothetical protein
VLATGGVVAYAAASAERVWYLVLALGIASAFALAGALLRASPDGVVPALVGVGAAWAVAAWTRGSGAVGATVLAAVGLFVAAELSYWSLEQASVPDEPELLARRAAGLAIRAGAALAVAATILELVAVHASGGVALEAVGVVAAVAVLGLAYTLSRPGRTGEGR